MRVMLKFSSKAELTDTEVATTTRGIITFDLKEAPYMLKVSANAWKGDSYNQDTVGGFITGLFL